MLKIITGRAKSGKSEYCSREFASEALGTFASPGKTGEVRPAYYIVPEQYTVDAEKRILSLDIMKGKALLYSEVLSFKRLVHRILGKLGGGTGKTLTRQGRAILLSSVLLSVKDGLEYFTDIHSDPSETLTLLDLFDELETYNSDKTELCEKLLGISSGSEGTQKVKFADIAYIYKAYSDKVDELFVSGNKAWNTAAALSLQYGFFSGSKVWIDEFTGFTDPETEFISCMLKGGADVTVCLTTSRENEPVFYSVDKTLDRLKSVATDAKCGFSVCGVNDILSGSYGPGKSLIRLLESRYTKIRPVPLSEEDISGTSSESVKLFSCPDNYSEIVNCARAIDELTLRGVGYGEIAVAVRNIDDYAPYVGRVFSGKNIPYYIDDVRNVNGNPAVVTVKALIDLYVYDMRPEDVTLLLKNGFIVGDRSRADELENYILSHNLRYSSKYKKVPIPELKEIFGLYSRLKESFENASDVKEGLSGFTRILKSMEIEAKARDISDRLYLDGDREKSEEFARVWNLILELFGQIEAFSPDNVNAGGRKTAAVLKNYFEIGFSDLRIGFIPQEKKAVRIIGTGRSRTGNPRAVIVLGANEGVMPSETTDSGFLRDFERDLMEENGIGLADSSLSRAYKELYMIYAALFAPSDYLYVSYASRNGNGDALLPSSRVIGRITALIPGMKIIDAGRALQGGETTEEPEKSFDMTPEIARGLVFRHERPVMSISQIESYNQCPLAFLLERGFKLTERPDGEFRINDLGSIMHSVVEKGGMDLSKAPLSEMPDEEIKEYAKKLADRYFGKTLSDFYPEFDLIYSEKNKLMMSRLRDFCTVVLNAVGYQYKMSNFKTLAFECDFGKGGLLPPVTVSPSDSSGFPVDLTGRIDRIDAFSDGNNVYISVVDYKSSNKKVYPSDISNGLRIQLITYLKAATENEKASKTLSGMAGAAGLLAKPGAGLYFVFKDGFKKSGTRGSVPEDDGAVNDLFKMHGIILDAQEIRKGLNGLADNVVYAGKSDLIDSDTFVSYSRAVDDAVRKTADNISGGHFSPCPEKTQEGQIRCVYCPYGSVCGIVKEQ